MKGTVTSITPTAWTILIDQGYPTAYLQGSNGHLCSLYDSTGNLRGSSLLLPACHICLAVRSCVLKMHTSFWMSKPI